jgi:DNA repair photolyase
VDIRSTLAKSILTKTSGFIAEAGFTHSLSPARNCTFGCTYCYVPTMGVYGGLIRRIGAKVAGYVVKPLQRNAKLAKKVA